MLVDTVTSTTVTVTVHHTVISGTLVATYTTCLGTDTHSQVQTHCQQELPSILSIGSNMSGMDTHMDPPLPLPLL